jgi:hypothetical protein
MKRIVYPSFRLRSRPYNIFTIKQKTETSKIIIFLSHVILLFYFISCYFIFGTRNTKILKTLWYGLRPACLYESTNREYYIRFKKVYIRLYYFMEVAMCTVVHIAVELCAPFIEFKRQSPKFFKNL